MDGRRRLAALSLLPLVLAGDRTFIITNSCAFKLWPAVTNYGEHDTYKGVRGWEAPPGNATSVTMHSPWNGRIWPRRACTFDDTGKGSCITGDCPGGLECQDQTIGWVNVAEFNLDSWGGNDFWDISSVPGWTVPMSVEPDGCDSVSCTEDVLSKCPDDRMKQKDSDGNVIGCLSACMAGINAVEPSVNCCSGKYNDEAACHSAEVDFYDVLKPLCEHAYWYPYDSRPESPTVDYACPAANNPNYKITFCPGGSGSSSPKASGGGGTGHAQPTSFSPTAGQVNAATTIRSGSGTGASVEATGSVSIKAEQVEADSSGAGASMATKTSAGSSSPTSSSSPTGAAKSENDITGSSSSTSASWSNDDQILGLDKPVFFALVSAAAVLVLLALFFACRSSRSNRTPAATTSAKESEDSGSESEGSSGSSGDEGKGVHRARSLGRSATNFARQPLLAGGRA